MYQPGLKGVIATETEISFIDGEQGTLLYRGLPAYTFVQYYTFEETAFYILYGKFPNESECDQFESKLVNNRHIPKYVKKIMDQLPENLGIMDVLRTTISSLDMNEEEAELKLIAVIPTIISYRYRKMKKLQEVEPDPSIHSHVENFVYMLTEKKEKNVVAILETYLILTMEHGLNASTFAARVTISTKSDLIAAITSALGTMKGPLHGGAPTGVIRLLDEINTIDRIHDVILAKLKKKERIMGFGHRVYKTVDPRATALKDTITNMDEVPLWMELAIETERETIKLLNEYKPNQKLYTNVEYYAAAIMKTLDIDSELFTAIFSSSRIVGWCAHAIEQSNNNTIYRPAVKYVGKNNPNAR
ncbi:citrate synthase [Oceanobacillus limi]|uniref:Citrate synthase n=1 Tax=Oceanobacillus limi TaxID=930131 RepID=A0A1H9ZB09_9BACI|nr:citrate/2-methylcitrate synthase [Oceanobacillus limi]SES78750.1 citrate synthase [Oceanobacillus limi]